jgi:hypothetical protein
MLCYVVLCYVVLCCAVQDVRFILQVEAASHDGSSPVVVALTPLVSDLVKVFSLETADLPPPARDDQGTHRSALLASDEPSAGIVDELWVLVLLHCVEVLLDLAHLLLALCTLLLPWRALQLLVAVSETDKRGAWREAQALHGEYCDARDCLAEYRAGVAPLMNSLAKQPRGGGESDDWRLRAHYHYLPAAVTQRLQDLEDRSWRPYCRTLTRLLKRAGKGPATVRALGEALRGSHEAGEAQLQLWAFRTTFNTLSPEEEQQWRVIARRPLEAEDEQGGISALLVQVVDAAEAQANRVQRDSDQLVERRLVSRTVTVTVALLVPAARRAMLDSFM